MGLKKWGARQLKLVRSGYNLCYLLSLDTKVFANTRPRTRHWMLIVPPSRTCMVAVAPQVITTMGSPHPCHPCVPLAFMSVHRQGWLSLLVKVDVRGMGKMDTWPWLISTEGYSDAGQPTLKQSIVAGLPMFSFLGFLKVLIQPLSTG